MWVFTQSYRVFTCDIKDSWSPYYLHAMSSYSQGLKCLTHHMECGYRSLRWNSTLFSLQMSYNECKDIKITYFCLICVTGLNRSILAANILRHQPDSLVTIGMNPDLRRFQMMILVPVVDSIAWSSVSSSSSVLKGECSSMSFRLSWFSPISLSSHSGQGSSY